MQRKKFKVLLILCAALGTLCLLLGLYFGGKSGDASKSAKEEELACFLENGRGVGRAAVSLCYDADGRIVGAAVVCAGGDDPVVRAEVIRLLSAALGVGSNRIYVSGGEVR